MVEDTGAGDVDVVEGGDDMPQRGHGQPSKQGQAMVLPRAQIAKLIFQKIDILFKAHVPYDDVDDSDFQMVLEHLITHGKLLQPLVGFPQVLEQWGVIVAQRRGAVVTSDDVTISKGPSRGPDHKL